MKKVPDLEYEARDYLNHNPNDTEIGFVILSTEQLAIVKQEGCVEVDEYNLFHTMDNE